MSSIFDEKLEFIEQKYRTPKLNTGLQYIFQTINDLEDNKQKTGDTFSNVSRKVLKAGLEPARILLSIGF